MAVVKIPAGFAHTPSTGVTPGRSLLSGNFGPAIGLGLAAAGSLVLWAGVVQVARWAALAIFH